MENRETKEIGPFINLYNWDSHRKYRYHVVEGRYLESGHMYHLRFACRLQAEWAFNKLKRNPSWVTVQDIESQLNWYDGRYHSVHPA